MKEFENKNFKVTIEGNTITIVKKNFNDMYVVKLNENNKLVANSSLALKYAMNLRVEFGF